jgi:hypothetical protein
MRCPECLAKIPAGLKICRNCGSDVSAIASFRFERNMLIVVLAVGSTFIGTLMFVAFH